MLENIKITDLHAHMANRGNFKIFAYEKKMRERRL
jgi:hypothetical protein